MHDRNLVNDLGPKCEKGDTVRKKKDLKMEGQVEEFVQYWLNERHALKSAYKSTVTKFPNLRVVLNQVYGLSGKFASLTRSTPGGVANNVNW
jgi:hypothetical protein